MTIDQVDVDKMCAETAGYFNREMIINAFGIGTNARETELTAGIFRCKTLPEILEIYGFTPVIYLGLKDVAIIMYIARFFPRYFTD